MLLFGCSQTIGQLVDRLKLSQPLVSKHLRARADGLTEIEDRLAPHRRFWSSRRAALDPTATTVHPPEPSFPPASPLGGPGRAGATIPRSRPR